MRSIERSHATSHEDLRTVCCSKTPPLTVDQVYTGSFITRDINCFISFSCSGVGPPHQESRYFQMNLRKTLCIQNNTKTVLEEIQFNMASGHCVVTCRDVVFHELAARCRKKRTGFDFFDFAQSVEKQFSSMFVNADVHFMASGVVW